MTDEEMTKEFTEMLAGCDGDNEIQHIEADEKIAELLSGLGYEKLAGAFLKAQEDFWYA